MRKSNETELYKSVPGSRGKQDNRRPQVAALLTLLAAIALAILMGAPTRADSFDDVGAALKKSDLRAALTAARKAADDNPSDAVAQQVCGVLEIANGNVKEAEKSFDNAVQQGDALDPANTGLEKFDWNGSVLHAALNRWKVSIALDSGGASAYNNRAAMLIVLGHIDDALSDLDTAMQKRPHWALPSANAAVAWLENNSPRKAKQYANQALSYHGGPSAKVYTSLAVAQMGQKLWNDADQSFKHAEDYDHDYPYELYERSQWFQSQGQTRDAQRALFQAIALDPSIADEDRLQARNRYSAGGGSAQSDHEHLFNIDPFAGLALQSILQRDRGIAGDQSNAYQRRDFSQTMLGFGHGAHQTGLFLSFLNESGGRPGGVDQFVVPNATFGFRRANVALFQNFELSGGRTLLFESTYRHNNIDLRSSPEAENFQPLNDSQFGLEGRYETPVFQKSRLSVGYSWLNTSRQIEQPPVGDPLYGPSYTSPIEPNDQILQAGDTNLQTVYAISSQPASSRVNTAYGPVAAANGHSVFVLPYVDVHLATSAHVGYRASILPRLMNANADLLPVWTLASPIAQTDENHDETNTNDYNQNPFIPGATGRVISLEFTQSQLLRNLSYLTTTAFHREFHDIDFLSQDPNISPTLLLTHVPFGTTTGVTLQYTQPLPHGLNVQLGTTLQTSTGTLPLSGAPRLDSLPEVPNISGIAGLGYDRGAWEVSVHTIHIGSRTSVEQSPLPTGIGAICGLCSYQVTTVAPMTIITATVTHHLPNGQDIVFILQPVSSAGYYVNYPKKPFLSLGYNYHY